MAMVSKGQAVLNYKRLSFENSSSPPSEKTGLDRLIEAGHDITGNLLGSAAGYALGGPFGAALGGAIAPALKHILSAADDVIHRALSSREKTKIGATIAFAAAKIQERIGSGAELRDDDFFKDTCGTRSTADEVAESVVLISQREHEEKKLKCYGTLLANLAFAKSIDRGYANFLVRTAEGLSYRQLCLLALFTLKTSIQGHGLRTTDYRSSAAIGQSVSIEGATLPVLYGIYDLYTRGLVSCVSLHFSVSSTSPRRRYRSKALVVSL